MKVVWVGIINETKLAIGYESLNRFCREARGPQQQEEIAPDQIALLQRPRILALFTAHSSNLLSWGLVWFQDKVKTFRALVLYSPSKHILCFTLLNVQCACVWLIERNAQTNVKQELCPNLRFCGNLIRFMAEIIGGLYWPANVKRHPKTPPGEQAEMNEAYGRNFPFLVKLSGLWLFHNCLGIRSTNLICQIIDFQGTCDPLLLCTFT